MKKTKLSKVILCVFAILLGYSNSYGQRVPTTMPTQTQQAAQKPTQPQPNVINKDVTQKAQTQTQYNIIDNDQDGIDDREEQRLLEKFRPYYKFSKQGKLNLPKSSINPGFTEEHRPADVLWFIRRSRVIDSDNENNKSSIVPQNTLAGDPSKVLFSPSDILTKPYVLTNYHIDPLTDVPLVSGKDPARSGADWNEVMQKRNIGLYGHVVPIKLKRKSRPDDGALDYDRNRILSNSDVGEIFYKIEYWQFFGYNNCYCPDAYNHEGDWITMQLIYNPHGGTVDSIETVLYYEHGQLEIRFDMAKGKGPIPVSFSNISNRFIEYHGANYRKPCFCDTKAIKTDYINQVCSNNTIIFCEDPATHRYTHPVAYIEVGSHEPWPTSDGWFTGCPNHDGDDTEHSFLTLTPPNLGEIEHPLNYSGNLEVLHFNGSWGAKNGGARGPCAHTQWTWPASSSVRWLLKDLSD